MKGLMSDHDAWISEYGKHPIIESTNLMIKKKTGCTIVELLPESRVKRALFKAFAFNAHNAVRLAKD